MSISAYIMKVFLKFTICFIIFFLNLMNWSLIFIQIVWYYVNCLKLARLYPRFYAIMLLKSTFDTEVFDVFVLLIILSQILTCFNFKKFFAYSLIFFGYSSLFEVALLWIQILMLNLLFRRTCSRLVQMCMFVLNICTLYKEPLFFISYQIYQLIGLRDDACFVNMDSTFVAVFVNIWIF